MPRSVLAMRGGARSEVGAAVGPRGPADLDALDAFVPSRGARLSTVLHGLNLALLGTQVVALSGLALGDGRAVVGHGAHVMGPGSGNSLRAAGDQEG